MTACSAHFAPLLNCSALQSFKLALSRLLCSKAEFSPAHCRVTIGTKEAGRGNDVEEKRSIEKRKRKVIPFPACLPSWLIDRLSMHDISAITESRIYPASHPNMSFIDRSQSGELVWIGNTNLYAERITCAHTVRALYRYCTVLYRYSTARQHHWHCWERQESPHSTGSGNPHHQPASAVRFYR